MATKLDITLKEVFASVEVGDRLDIIVTVTARGRIIPNAAVTVTVSGGGAVNPASGVSDVNGIFRCIFVPTTGAYGEFKITFNAALSPLDPGSAVLTVQVKAPPVEFFQRDSELLLGVYGIREVILAYLADEMSKDPDLYASTGATQPPIFLNNFSYEARTFPQLVISGGSLTAVRSSIGNNDIGLGFQEDADGNVFGLKGGINELQISLTAMAESKAVQEKMMDKAKSIIWGKRQWGLLQGGIVVTAINTGMESTEAWGAKLLYAASCNVSLWTQWALLDKSLLETETINVAEPVMA